MMAVNINCKRYGFLQWILDGYKVIETRNTHSLRCYVGKRIGLVQTGKGKATLLGFATVTEEIHYTSKKQFQQDYKLHRVAKGSYYDIKSEKYGYRLSDVVAIKPVQISTKGIIARQINEEQDYEILH